MDKDRPVVIADAALRLIGSEGARGLTHRGVDAEAGLPEGSTSYYCRRRADLLALALRRHAELDRRSLARLDAMLASDVKSQADLAKRLAATLRRWIDEQSNEELAARFELFLACSREPQLKQVVEEQRAMFLGILAQRLKMRGVPRSRSVAAAVIALIEGLLIERVRVGRIVLSPSELRELLTKLVAGRARSPARTRAQGRPR
jgi:DNA-binding transcriptional regulator YbjK